MAINSNFRPGTKISGLLDHFKMHNRLCGKPAATEMFLNYDCFEKLEPNLGGLAIFHTLSHTEDVWKIP